MGFIRYYQRERRSVKLIDKRHSILMKAINIVLAIASKLKIVSISNFMGGYVTTIGKSIYSTPVWTLDMKAKPVVVHELAHVEQWGFMYALKYIFSPTYRLKVESICIQAEMLCFPENFMGQSQLEARALRLYGYGISIRGAAEELMKRKKEVDEGTGEVAARVIHGIFKAWKTEHTNEV